MADPFDVTRALDELRPILAAEAKRLRGIDPNFDRRAQQFAMGDEGYVLLLLHARINGWRATWRLYHELPRRDRWMQSHQHGPTAAAQPGHPSAIVGQQVRPDSTPQPGHPGRPAA